MPNIYKRKVSTSRAEWSEENLKKAIEALEKKQVGLREASRIYDIPLTTLKRRFTLKKTEKTGLGPTSCLGPVNEKKIVAHIKKLQSRGFAPTRTMVRSMAFDLAEKLKIKHNFNTRKRMAGYPWFELFIKRNPELSIRTTEGVSSARALSMNKKDVDQYFALLHDILVQHNLLNKASHIFNVDETGLQLNNRPDQVVAIKGSKNVVSVTSAEKGETITVVACCSAEGSFIPPTCIFKGKNKKQEYEEGMPSGSTVYMSQKSAYINNELFLKWLKEQFVPRKPPGEVLLLLDGHTSHCNNLELLEYAAENNVILVCLPSHTTQFLQPLDRGFFKSLKGYYYEACNFFIRTNPGKRLNRLQFGNLLNSAWQRAATIQNAQSSFRATGIVPFDPSAIPEYAFLVDQSTSVVEENRDPDVLDVPSPTSSNNRDKEEAIIGLTPTYLTEDLAQPGCSGYIAPRQKECSTEKRPELEENLTVNVKNKVDEAASKNKETPGKILDIVSPVPKIKAAVLRKRSKQLCTELTSMENISEKKKKLNSTKKVKPKKIEKKFVKTLTKQSRKKSSSSEDEEPNYDDSSEASDESDQCIGCGEHYSQTKKTDDWIECMRCKRWVHEGCSKYLNFCDICGKKVCQTKY